LQLLDIKKKFTELLPLGEYRQVKRNKCRGKHTGTKTSNQQQIQQLPVLLMQDLFQETEQCSTQAADDRHRVTGLCEVELEHA